MSGARSWPWGGRRVFYGWYIVAVGMLVAFCSGPGQSYVVGVFVDSIIADTGFSRSGVSLLYAIGTGLSAVMVMQVSRLADRHGPRLMLVLVALGLGVACLGMAFATGAVTLFVAFALVRALGQGSLPVNGTLLVAQWFTRYRGRAMAVIGVGFALSNGLLPPLARYLIDEFGWRTAYAALGVMVWVLVIPPVLLVVRDRPEELGLRPDGAAAPPEIESRPMASAPAPPAARGGIFSTRAFWLLAIPMAAPGFIVTALVFHQSDIFEERGLSASVAAGVFVFYAIASAGTNILAGILADKWGPKRLFVANLVLLGVAMGVLPFMDSTGDAIGYAMVLGATGGIQSIVSGVSWVHYYGREGLGRVQGAAMMVSITGAALGPLPVALLRDIGGGYGLPLAAMGGLLAVCIILAAIAGPKPALR